MPAIGRPFLPRPTRGKEPLDPLFQQGQLREVLVREKKKIVGSKGRIRIMVLLVFFLDTRVVSDLVLCDLILCVPCFMRLVIVEWLHYLVSGEEQMVESKSGPQETGLHLEKRATMGSLPACLTAKDCAVDWR